MGTEGKVNYAIVGFGGIAENRIAKEGFALDKSRFEENPYASLAGVTDINPGRKEAAEKLEVKWYASAEEIFEDPEIEAVYIASNNLSHASLATQSMQAGKHPLVEKPLATTLEDAYQLQKMAREKNLSIGVDHMMLYNVYSKKAAQLLKEKAIGEINDIVTHMEFYYGSTPEEAASWRCNNPQEIGGPIGDVASHCLYVAEYLIGARITAVQAVYLPKSLGIKVEEGAVIYYEFANGGSGSARVSFNQARGGLVGTLTNLGYEVYGSEGVIRGLGTLFQLSGHPGEPIKLRLELDKGTEVEAVEPEEIKNIYQEIIAAHARSILESKPMDASDGIHNLALVLAAHKSAQNAGEKIKITTD